MLAVPFGNWAPDIAGIDQTVVSTALNVFPQANGYGPVPSLNPITLALPAACKGAISVKSSAGVNYIFAGTATALYRYNNGTLAWDDVSEVGNSYSVPDGDYWSFAVFGDLLIATHVNDDPQVINVASGTAFATLGGTPPRAKFVGVVGDFVVLGGLVDYPRRLQWSGLNDAAFWAPGVNSSDYQDFPDGGFVTGLAGGEFGIVFQESVIRRMVFAPGAPEIFQFTRVEDSRGAVSPYSVIRIGPRVFFLDRDGFYAFTGGVSASIGTQKVNEWFVKNADRASIGQALAVSDITGPRVLWGFKSIGSSDPTLLDLSIVYDWSLDRWSLIDQAVRVWLISTTPFVSLDSIADPIDDITLSLDSAFYAGNVPVLGGFGTDNRLAFLEGSVREAVIETGDAMIARPRRAFVRGIRLDGDVESFAVQVGTRENLGALVSWNVESNPTATRFAPARSSGRYHRGRIRIPAAQDWSFVSGIEIDATPEGLR